MADVTTVIGVRGFGIPICRRLGQSGRLLIGDHSAEILERARNVLNDEGYSVTAVQVDITDAGSVNAFAAQAAELGRVRSMVCTAGISGSMGEPARIFAVNMLGTLHLLDAFVPLAGEGSVLIIIASSAAYMMPLSAEDDRILARGSRDELAAMFQTHEASKSGLSTYCLAKRGNQLRVQALAPALGKSGARILTVSPGVMATPMSQFERDAGSAIDEAVANNPMGRYGHPEDIAAAVSWLSCPGAAFVTGIDLLVDGGMTAAMKWPGQGLPRT